MVNNSHNVDGGEGKKCKSEIYIDKIRVQENNDIIIPRVMVFPQTAVKINKIKKIIGKAYINETQGMVDSG